MLKQLRARFRRKDTDAILVLAIKNSVHGIPWHIAPTMQLVVVTTASKLRSSQEGKPFLLHKAGAVVNMAVPRCTHWRSWPKHICVNVFDTVRGPNRVRNAVS